MLPEIPQVIPIYSWVDSDNSFSTDAPLQHFIPVYLMYYWMYPNVLHKSTGSNVNELILSLRDESFQDHFCFSVFF